MTGRYSFSVARSDLCIFKIFHLPLISDSCTVPLEAQAITKHCNDYYSQEKEDRSPLNLPGWIPINVTAQFTNVSELCPAPWRYSPSQDFQLLPNWGFFNTYGGGGYVADLGYGKDTAVLMISNLRENGWIDRYTRAVLLEFTIYNPFTGYLSISTYYYEILPTGYGNAFPRIDTILLTSTESGLYQFYLICQLLFIILVFVSICQEVYKVYRQRCAYFRSVWNLIEILQLVFSSLVVTLYVFKSKIILKNVSKLKQNPFVNVSFQDVITWHEAENAALAFTVFVATLKLLRMIRFNPHVIMLVQSFRVSRDLLISYSALFFVIFVSYGQLGRLTLGNNMFRYSTFLRSLAAELLMCLGGNMEIEESRGVNRVLGPFFAFTFVSVNSFIFVNFFVAILNDSYEEAKEDTDRDSEEFEMGGFIMGQLAGMLGFRKKASDQEHTEENMERSSLSSTKSPCTEEAKPPSATPKKLSETSTVIQHEKELSPQMQLPDKKIKSPLKDKLRKSLKVKDEQDKQMDMEVGSASSANEEERILQRLDSLTSSIEKDHVREDVELLCFIWLLSDEENRASRRRPTPQSETSENSSATSISHFSSNADTSDEQWGALEDEREDETSGQATDRNCQRDDLGGVENSQVTPIDVDDGEFYV